MEHKEYNGWYNYETWCVALWMGNDQGSYDYFREMAEQYDEVYGFADFLKEHHEESIEELEIPSCFASDLLSAAMSEVNWCEIAEHLIEEMEE